MPDGNQAAIREHVESTTKSVFFVVSFLEITATISVYFFVSFPEEIVYTAAVYPL